MGNRALIIFHDKDLISPTVYLHRHGGDVPALLGELAEYMKGRHGDAEYAAARFTGLCHRRISGNLSLGIMRNALHRADLDDAAALEALSPGDAGLVVVDAGDFTWKAYGGHLAGTRSAPAAPTLTLVKPSNPTH
jgi:hypothetical protein